MADIVDVLQRTIDAHAELLMRVAEMERKMDNTVRHGKVTDVDTKKQLARIEIGERDGKPLKSAWIPYAQLAGDYKSHRPPTKGQQLTMFAPNGEVRQAVLMPFTWSDNNKSPSEKEDEHVATYGKMKLREKAEQWTLSMGENVSIDLGTGTMTLKATTIVLECSDIRLGGSGASRELALRNTVTDDGSKNITDLSTAVRAI